MSIFGKLLCEAIETVSDVVEIGTSIISDTIKSPARLMDKADGDDISFLEDTKEKMRKIKDETNGN